MVRLMLSLRAAIATAALPSVVPQAQKTSARPTTKQVDVSKPKEGSQKPRCLPERVVGIAETAENYYASCDQK